MIKCLVDTINCDGLDMNIRVVDGKIVNTIKR